jgi:AraC family transcriptional regulator
MDANTIDLMMSNRFRLKRAPTLFATPISKIPIAFTRLRCDDAEHGRAGPVPPESSFAFQVLMKPIRSWEIWHFRSHAVLPPSGPGNIFLFDLSENPQLELHDPFDMVRFYISQSSLDSLAYERGLSRVNGLRVPKMGTSDLVMYGMALALTASMEQPNEAQTMFVEHIALAFHAHVAHLYGGASKGRHHAGGLAPWQLQRVCDAMKSELHVNHTIAALAAACGVSSSHFAQAFKDSTGLAPHRWLTRRRIERARELLAHNKMDIAEIALACGFVDQSHFSRVFTKVEKQSPGKWRRAVNAREQEHR